nr:MAG TPA: hypothetical protein [Caudoviricetes sp.]
MKEIGKNGVQLVPWLKNADKKVQKHGLLERNVGKQGLNR